MKLIMTIGGERFTVTPAGNRTSAAFEELLPLTLQMDDVNGNEKYAPPGRDLPVSATCPGTIRTGDLMLWGADGLVLFYKTFSTVYGYTRIGTLDNPTGLPSAVGRGSVTVTFEPMQKW